MGIKDLYLYDSNSPYRLDLGKLASSPVKAIAGYLSLEFGEPVFKISRIHFEDGRSVSVEGEHDFPYVCDSARVFPEGLLGRLCDEEDDEDDEDPGADPDPRDSFWGEVREMDQLLEDRDRE